MAMTSTVNSAINIMKLSRWLLWIRGDALVRGSSLLTLGQIFLAASGYLVNVALASILGVKDYGTYGLVISILVWLEMILAPGIGTALEKSVASRPQKAKTLMRHAIKVQGAIAVALFGVTFVLAPGVATLLNDSQLTFLLRFAAVDLLFFGFFRLGRGLNSALQHFGRVALISAVYALVKATAIPILALSELGLSGAIAGNTVASMVAVLVVFKLARGLGGASSTDAADDLRKSFVAVIPLSVFIAASMILVSLDVWAVKYIDAPDAIIGFYVAATMLPKALIMVSGGRIGMMTAVVGRCRADNDYASTRQALLKISCLFGSMIAAGVLLVYLFANPLMTLIFPASYAPATPYLQVLIISYGAFAVAEMFSIALIAFDKCWALCAIWVIAALLAIPMYVHSGEFWGPLGIAYSIGALSFAVSVCVLWMLRIELAKLRACDPSLAHVYAGTSIRIQTR